MPGGAAEKGWTGGCSRFSSYWPLRRRGKVELSNGGEDQRWLGNPDVWFPLLLLFAGTVFFSDALFSSKNFYFRDILNFHFPLRKLLLDSYTRGEFPLWNPYVYLGQPMLANPNYMAFFPTNLFHLFLPFNYAFKLHFIVQPILGAVGLYCFQRRLGIAALASFGGSLVYQFCGTVLSLLNLYSIVQVVALMPWIGWAFHRALSGRFLGRSLLFGAILGLQIITLEPLLLQCVGWLLAGIALLFILESGEQKKAGKRILGVGLVGGLYGMALSAVQVLPTLELIPRSARALGLDMEQVGAWSMHPLEILNLLVPNLFGDPFALSRSTYWGEQFHHGREAYLVSYFMGSAGIALSIISFLSDRRKARFVFAAIALIGAGLALGSFSPVYRWLYEYIPYLTLGRYPAKYFLMTALALAILCGLGIEYLVKSEKTVPSQRRKLFVSGSIGIICSLMLLGIWAWMRTYPAPLSDYVSARIDASLIAGKNLEMIVSQLSTMVRRTGLFLLLVSSLILILAIWKGTRFFSWLIVLVVSVELTTVNVALSPLISNSDVEFVPEVNRYLQGLSRKKTERVFHLDPPWGVAVRMLWSPTRSYAWSTYYYRLTGQPMYGINNGIQYALYESVDLLTTLESEELWRKYLSSSGEGRVELFRKLNVGILLSVSEIRDERVRFLTSFDTFSERTINVYEIDAPLPRAYFVTGVERVGSRGEALQRFADPTFPYRTTVVLEDPRIRENEGEIGGGTVELTEYGDTRVICNVDAKVDGYLVLLDSYYPGWQARVDSREEEVLRGNYAFRAVRVPAGSHSVEFRYRPRTFRVGLALTCLALLAGIIKLFWHLGASAKKV